MFNAKSANKAIVCGVPQGSVLDPIFFLLHVSGIYKSALDVCLHLFADNTCIFYFNKSYKKIEIDVKNAFNNTANWLKANKLTLNVEKSNLLVFTVRKNFLSSYLQSSQWQNTSFLMILCQEMPKN